MTDRELLELAAKAAGIDVVYRVTTRVGDGETQEGFFFRAHGLIHSAGFVFGAEEKSWNPLADDGDALRLAVELKLEIFAGQGPDGDITTVCAPQELDLESCGERHGTDAHAATRRAIVRTAAAIGKSN
ncbi:hypothetical protein [Burkholderia lata]|uniref:hypothetical protein n=1 Tax=Burkholderia lata (strain ATCC 17760 / DSM 23089 / LMG 22485 / NCIMB 9086 / R18194 / 383) TaxID=482957 RepID=UPI001583821C|nr:hypothetical protein [Burkholderia lata]